MFWKPTTFSNLGLRWNEPLLLPNNQLFRLYHPLNWAKLPIFIEYDLSFCCKTKNDLSWSHWSVMFAFVTQRNSGKFLGNGSMKVRQFPFQIFFISVKPPGPADKILHRLHYLQVKTRQTCHAKSRNPLTEWLKTQLHSVYRHDSPGYFRRSTSCEIASHLCFLSKDCLYPSTQLYGARQGLLRWKIARKTHL